MYIASLRGEATEFWPPQPHRMGSRMRLSPEHNPLYYCEKSGGTQSALQQHARDCRGAGLGPHDRPDSAAGRHLISADRRCESYSNICSVTLEKAEPSIKVGGDVNHWLEETAIPYRPLRHLTARPGLSPGSW